MQYRGAAYHGDRVKKLDSARMRIVDGSRGLPIRTVEKYRRLYASQGYELPEIGESEQVRGVCVHRGELLRQVTCRPCQGTREAEIHECAIHGECTFKNGVRTNGMGGTLVKACKTCEEWESQATL